MTDHSMTYDDGILITFWQIRLDFLTIYVTFNNLMMIFVSLECYFCDYGSKYLKNDNI